MRLLYVFLIVALTSACCAQEEEADGDIVDDGEVEVTEPPRFLIRPRRPLKLNRSTKPPALEESEDELQTSAAATKATTTKRPASRSRNSARTTTKAPVVEENLSKTSTKRPAASKSRNRNRNRNRSKSRNRNRSTTLASDDVDDVETTTKNSKRRGGSNGRRTTTAKTSGEARTTTPKSTRSRTKSPAPSSRNNRKRTTTPKSTTLTTVADEIKEPPTTTKSRLPPRPINLSHFKPALTTPIDLEDEDANVPNKLPASKIPLQPTPEPVEGIIEGKLSHFPAPVEVPLKRPLRPIPLEGAIIEEQPIGPLEKPVPNTGGLKWEPVGIPPKIVGPVDRTKSGRVQVPSDPQEKEKESNAEAELPAPALARPRPSTLRPLLSRPIPTEPAAREEEEEINAFSKPTPIRPDVGVAPKPVGPVSSIRPPKRLHNDKDSLSRGSLTSGSRKSTAISADEDNDFPTSKSTTTRPKLPRSSSTRKPSKNSAVNLDEDEVKPTRRPRTKSTTTTAKNLELDEIVTKHTRTPYPLRYDDGSPIKSSKPKSSNSGIFSPFEEDLLDDIRGKPTASVFDLKDKRVSSKPQSRGGDEAFESKPIKGSNSRKERPLSRSIPTSVPKFANEEKTTPPFRPSKQLSVSSPATPVRSVPRPQAKFTVADDKIEEKEVMTKPRTKIDNVKPEFVPEVESPPRAKAPVPIHTQPSINLPPRSRFLTMTADTGLKMKDKVPPVQDDPFFVPAADISKSPSDGEEFPLPPNRRKEMPFDDKKLLPATGELEFRPEQPTNLDKNANREFDLPLPRKIENEDSVLMLKPITSRPSAFLEDDVDSLALPPARRVSSFAPPPNPRTEETPPRANLQVGIESPSFVIRKPVNLTSPSEEDSLPVSQPKNSQEAPRKAKITEAEFQEYDASLAHDPRSLAAALPTQRSSPKSTPRLLDPIPEAPRNQAELKSREQPKVNPTQPQRTALTAEEAEEYEDEEYES